MKILIGTDEIAGWIHHYKNGFENKGHSVTTAVFQKNDFYHYEYDYLLEDIFLKKSDGRKLQSNQYLKRAVRKINNRLINFRYEKFIRRLIDEHDMLVLLWHPFLTGSLELAYARSKNKKVVSIFVGSDVRYFKAFQQEFDVSQWTFPAEWDHANPAYHLQLIRNAERYSDIIYSVPDQGGLQLKPYYHLQVPVAIEKFKYAVPGNRVPKVVHAPSVPFKKGTDIIEGVLDRLKSEGVQFDLITVRNMPNHKLLELLSGAYVLVDEIVYNGPGALSFEGMLSGCAVATRYIEASPEVFRPPVWSINACNIYEKLKELLTNTELRKRLAIEGREYDMRHNASDHVASGILNDLEHSRTPYYHPEFLREKYNPFTEAEIQTINQWTGFVQDCDWYKKYVTPGERAGLIF
jgi:hypothetical protein